MDGIQSTGVHNDRRRVEPPHPNAYPLGTVVRLIEDDSRQYFLVVLTEFDVDNKSTDPYLVFEDKATYHVSQ